MDESKEGSYRREGWAARKGRNPVTLLSIFQTLEPPSHEQSNKTRAINPIGKTPGVHRVWVSPDSHGTQGLSQYFQQSCSRSVWVWNIILGSSGRTVHDMFPPPLQARPCLLEDAGAGVWNQPPSFSDPWGFQVVQLDNQQGHPDVYLMSEK